MSPNVDDIIKLIKLLERSGAAQKAIPATQRRIQQTLPNPAEMFPNGPESMTDQEAGDLYRAFIGAVEEQADVARDYADAAQAVAVHVRASLEPGLEAKGILPKPWTPDEEAE